VHNHKSKNSAVQFGIAGLNFWNAMCVDVQSLRFCAIRLRICASRSLFDGFAMLIKVQFCVQGVAGCLKYLYTKARLNPYKTFFLLIATKAVATRRCRAPAKPG
jgi:hypothetical protein